MANKKVKLFTPKHLAALANLKQNLAQMSPEQAGQTQSATTAPQTNPQPKLSNNQTVPGVNESMAKTLNPAAIAVLKKADTQSPPPPKSIKAKRPKSQPADPKKVNFGSGKKDLNPVKHQENVKNFKAAIQEHLKKPSLPTKSLEPKHHSATVIPKAMAEKHKQEAEHTATVKTHSGNTPPKTLPGHEATKTAPAKASALPSGGGGGSPKKSPEHEATKTAPIADKKMQTITPGVKKTFQKKPSIFNMISASFRRPVTGALENRSKQAAARANMYRSEPEEGADLKK